MQEFPPADVSLSPSKQLPVGMRDVVWIRACELAAQPCLFGSPSPVSAKIHPGRLGAKWAAFAAAALATHPNILPFAVPDAPDQDWVNDTEARRHGNYYRGYHKSPDLHPGIFKFRFFLFGQWTEVVVDDYLPCQRSSGELVYARSSNTSEFGLSLLEKAYAKLFFGSYEAMENSCFNDAFMDLTGSAPEMISIADFQGKNNSSELFDFLRCELAKQSLISCAPARDSESMLVGDCAIITVKRVSIRMSNMRRRKVDVVKMRNPWTPITNECTVWSEEWQVVPKRELARVGLVCKNDDGRTFFMSFNVSLPVKLMSLNIEHAKDFLKHFSSVSVSALPRFYQHAPSNGRWQYTHCLQSKPEYPPPRSTPPISKSDFAEALQLLLQVESHREVTLLITLMRRHTDVSMSELGRNPKTASSMTLWAGGSGGSSSESGGLPQVCLTLHRVEENRKHRLHNSETPPSAQVMMPTYVRNCSMRVGGITRGRWVLAVAAGRRDVVVRIENASIACGIITVQNDVRVKMLTTDCPAPVPRFNKIFPVAVFRVTVVRCENIACIRNGRRWIPTENSLNVHCVLKFLDTLFEPRNVVRSQEVDLGDMHLLRGNAVKAGDAIANSWFGRLLSSYSNGEQEDDENDGENDRSATLQASPIRPPPAGLRTWRMSLPHRPVSTAVVRGSDPVFDAQFVWAVRRPRDARLLVEVRNRYFARSGAVGEVLKGYAEVVVADFVDSGRRDRWWDVGVEVLQWPVDTSAAEGSDGTGLAPPAKIFLRVKYESSVENL
ncbi:Calpain-6 [Entophlyctis sp. JEL0112]|nr:Calpain-6 [Entophlyctis sp. JEL0112]